jgi:methylated-DNA-protein-cysteine methyltransferase-like protein
MGVFRDKVIKTVKAIPYGKVMSYGQIAMECGSPRASRQVGGVLRHLDAYQLDPDTGVPWWRVVNKEGILTIKRYAHEDAVLQKQLLMEEGVEFVGEFQLDMEKYNKP